jgi:GT2 family glycosyltransferase
MEPQITGSIVLYKNNFNIFRRAINSFLNTELDVTLFVVDNSPSTQAERFCSDERIDYIFNNENIGFGAGHNIAIKKSIDRKSKCHLVFNPDVYFEKGAIEKLYEIMQSSPDVGLIMPRILYPDGSMQYLCKLLPSPLDLIRRRLVPSVKWFHKGDYVYELRFTDYSRVMEVPYLSGCFMFMRTEALSRVGIFDERFFMYLDDTDLSRRIHNHYRTVYHPHVVVFHEYEKGSYKKWKLLKYHIWSAVKYFNKWGYFFDRQRRQINRRTIAMLTTVES